MFAPFSRSFRPVHLHWLICLSTVVMLSALTCVLPAPAMARAASAAPCAQVAAQAGFSDEGLVNAVAVGLAESACNPRARLHNGPTSGCPDGSIDRGMWQINDCYHAEVSDGCAYNVTCNANAAYRISAGGSDFRQWTTYRNGRYRAFLDQAEATVGWQDDD